MNLPSTPRPTAAGLASAAWAAVVSAAVLAPAAAAQPSQDARTWLFGGVSFPARVDSFIALGTERWPQARRGTVLRYGTSLAPDATLDVHVQPLPPGGDAPQMVRQEFQQTLDELRRYSREGVSVSVDTVHAVNQVAGGWTYEGHVAEVTLRGVGTTGRSLAYVFAKPPSFVKIRITHDAATRSRLEPRIQAFLAGILERLDSFQDRGPPGGP